MTRLDDLINKKERLSHEEGLELLREAPGGTTGGSWTTRAVGRVALDLIDSINRFEDSSRKLMKWLIVLTIVLVILTVVIAGITVLLWMRG